MLKTGQNAPSNHLTSVLFKLSKCHSLVFDAVQYTMHPWSNSEQTTAWPSIMIGSTPSLIQMRAHSDETGGLFTQGF